MNFPLMFIPLVLPWKSPEFPWTSIMSARIVNQLVMGSPVVAMKVVDPGIALIVTLAGANIAYSLNCLGPVRKARAWRLFHRRCRWSVCS